MTRASEFKLVHPQVWPVQHVRVRVRERLSATPRHVIGQGPAPGGGVVPCGGGGSGGGGSGGGECTFLRVYGLFLKSC